MIMSDTPGDVAGPIVCMDALQWLRSLDAESVDMILTDPPYNIGIADWDKQWASEAAYLNWCEQWTAECVRVLRPGGILAVWGTLKTDTFLRYKLYLSSITDLRPQNEIIWSYNWGGRSKSNFARKHEYCWVYSKGPDFTFNADDVRIPRKVTKNMRTGEDYTQGTIPTCVWEKNNHTTSKDHVGWHPSVKNADLLERMIKAYTNPGQLVIDPFAGSGTTGVAAARCGREFMGCDTSRTYVEKANRRIAEQAPTGK